MTVVCCIHLKKFIQDLNKVVPLLKGSLQKGHPSVKDKFLAASSVNECGAPSHQRTHL